jgi:hypothetical protein
MASTAYYKDLSSEGIKTMQSDRALAFQVARKRKCVTIRTMLDVEQMDTLVDFFAPRDVNFEPEVRSSHPVCASLLDYANRWVSQNPIQNYIEIGGGAREHIDRATNNNHCCLLMSDGRDEGRYKNALNSSSVQRTLFGPDSPKKEAAQDLLNLMTQKDLPSKHFCVSGTERCNYQATHAFSVHSAYDIPFELWPTIFEKHGLESATLWMHLPLEFIVAESMVDASSGYCYETFTDTGIEKIRFWFINDQSLAYEHNAENWKKYLIQPGIQGKHFNLMLEVAERIGPMVRIEMNKVYNPTKVTRVTSEVSGKFVRVPNVSEYFCCGKKSNNYPIVAPRDKVQNGRLWMFNAKDDDLTWSKFISYMRSQKSSVMIGAKAISHRWNIGDRDFLDICQSIYVIGLADRWRKQVNTDNIFKRMNTEKIASKSVFSRMSLALSETIHTFFDDVLYNLTARSRRDHHCGRRAIQRFRNNWLLDWDYECVKTIINVADMPRHHRLPFLTHDCGHGRGVPITKRTISSPESLNDSEDSATESESDLDLTPKSVGYIKGEPLLPANEPGIEKKPQFLGRELLGKALEGKDEVLFDRRKIPSCAPINRPLITWPHETVSEVMERRAQMQEVPFVTPLVSEDSAYETPSDFEKIVARKAEELKAELMEPSAPPEPEEEEESMPKILGRKEKARRTLRQILDGKCLHGKEIKPKSRALYRQCGFTDQELDVLMRTPHSVMRYTDDDLADVGFQKHLEEYSKHLEKEVARWELVSKDEKAQKQALIATIESACEAVKDCLDDEVLGSLRIVNGPMGCGKSHYVQSVMDFNSIIVVNTNELKREYQAKMPKFQHLVFTPHNALHYLRYCSDRSMHPIMRVYFDEAFLGSIGYVHALRKVSGCDVILVGDPKQINFVDFSKDFGDTPRLKTIADRLPGIRLRANYRNPIPTVRMLNQLFGYDMVPMSHKTTEIEFIKKSFLHYKPRGASKAISFTQYVKNHKLIRPYSANTVHESQGATHKNVDLLMDSNAKRLINDWNGHLAVALSRHTDKLVIYDIDDFIKYRIKLGEPLSQLHEDQFGLHSDTYDNPEPSLAASSEIQEHKVVVHPMI